MGAKYKLSSLKKIISISKKRLRKYSEYNLLIKNQPRGSLHLSTNNANTITKKRVPKLFIVGIIAGFYFSQIFNFSISNLSSFSQYSYNELSDDQDSITHLRNNENRTIADQLFHEVRVLCWIMTGPDNHETRAQNVKHTWGQRCNKLLFMSSAEDTKLGTVVLPVEEGYYVLWAKTKEAFKYVYEHYFDEYDWFLKADDDTYVIMENLRKMLYSYSPEFPIYFGSRRREPNVTQGIMHGGAGYVLSKEALKRFIEKGIFDSDVCYQGNDGREDGRLGECLANLEVLAGDSRDEYERETMFPHFLATQLNSAPIENTDNYWDIFYYKYHVGPSSVSDHAIAFHYVDTLEMYAFHYLIYHLRPFGITYPPDILPQKKLLDELITVLSLPSVNSNYSLIVYFCFITFLVFYLNMLKLFVFSVLAKKI